ncbi:MAG: glycosyltransferase family 2 protein [Planctomycetota bacterium]
MRTLIAIPVYNEQRRLQDVLERVLEQTADLRASGEVDVLAIDDGSTDASPTLLSHFPVEVIRHAHNRGYGRTMQDAIRWAAFDQFDWLITMDCDEQHEPAEIPSFLDAIRADDADVISGSRYLVPCECNDSPPPERRNINFKITSELNDRLGLSLTDGFCGYKAYRVEAVRALELTEDGYAFPMQFWVHAVAAGLRLREIPVRLIYNDLNRSFGGPLDDAAIRWNHYRRVMHCALRCVADRLPAEALEGVSPNPCAELELGSPT